MPNIGIKMLDFASDEEGMSWFFRRTKSFVEPLYFVVLSIH